MSQFEKDTDDIIECVMSALREHESSLMWAVTYKCRSTFYLDPRVSGITSADHARRIAAGVMGVSDPDNVHAYLIDIRN